MKITKWKAATTDGKRKGAFDLTMVSGLTLIGCTLVEGENGLFIGFPQRSWQSGGQTKYAATVAIEDKSARQRFNVQVLDALREARCIQ